MIRRRRRAAGHRAQPRHAAREAEPYLDRAVDLVLIMSVFPGFGGQSFIPEVLDKVRALRATATRARSPSTAASPRTPRPQAIEAGVDVMVAGTAVFGRPDRAAAIRALRAPR